MVVDEQYRDGAGRAAIGRDGKAQLAKAQRFAAAFDFIFEQAIADPRALAELVGLEAGVHRFQLPLGQLLVAHRGCVGIVVEPVVVGLEPQLGLRFGAEREALVERLVEKFEQRLILRPGLGSGLRERGGAHGSERQDGKQHQGNGKAHHILLSVEELVAEWFAGRNNISAAKPAWCGSPQFTMRS